MNGSPIHLSSNVRNLGIIISFEQNVFRICQTCYIELHRINSSRHYVSKDAYKTLISAFAPFGIDYCNSLLAGYPKQLIRKLQKCQNNAARLICRTPKSNYLSPVLHTIHWLPVEQRTEYKWLLLAFKSVNS